MNCSFIDYAKAFDCEDHNKLWKILQEMGIPDHLTCLLRNLYAGQEATVRNGHMPLGSWSCLWKSGRLGRDPDSGILELDRALGKGCSGRGGKAENLALYQLSGLIRRNGARRDPRIQKAGNPERSSLVETPCGETRTPGSERGGGEGWRG